MRLDFFQKLLPKGKTSNLGTSIYRDWPILFVTVSVLAILLLTYSYKYFIEIQSGKAFGAENIEPVGLEKIDLKTLSETVSFYEKRKEQFEALQKNRPPYQDPSI